MRRLSWSRRDSRAIGVTDVRNGSRADIRAASDSPKASTIDEVHDPQDRDHKDDPMRPLNLLPPAPTRHELSPWRGAFV